MQNYFRKLETLDILSNDVFTFFQDISISNLDKFIIGDKIDILIDT